MARWVKDKDWLEVVVKIFDKEINCLCCMNL